MNTLTSSIRIKVLLIGMIIFTLFLSVGCNTRKKNPPKAKYIFYFIADGMGLSHISLTESYLAETTDLNYSQARLNMTQMEHVGLARTHAQNRLITGSAAAGTALATGFKTSINTIGMTPDKQHPIFSIAHPAKASGMKVGIMSTVMVNHATPSAFYAHVPERNHYYEIGLQIAETNFDLFGGGGLADITGKENDKKSLKEVLSEKGITLIEKNDEYKNLQSIQNQLVFMHQRLDPINAMPFAIDRNGSDLSLSQIVSKAIELLDSPNGFFLMVEGGKIDWANHSNDAASSIHDIIDFDNAIGIALAFQKKNPDNTLIVVCSDHETGGLSLGHKKHNYESKPSLLKHQKVSLDSLSEVLKTYQVARNSKSSFSEIADTLQKYLGLGSIDLPLTNDEVTSLKEQFEKGFIKVAKKGKDKDEDEISTHKLAVLAVRILNTKAGLAWGTGAHTSQPTLVFASGAGATLFSGYYDNIDIPRKIIEAMQVDYKFEMPATK